MNKPTACLSLFGALSILVGCTSAVYHTPTPVPTATPASTLTVSANTLALPGLGGANGGSLLATETGPPATVSVSGCSGVATATVGAAAGMATPITVVGTASGICSLVVADSLGQQVAVTVTVTVTNVGGQ
jgi:hypothetical protein